MSTSRPPAPLRQRAGAGSKVLPLDAVDQIVRDGQTIGIGGTWLSARPMAAVRQLVRAGRRNLHVVSLTGSLDVDLLVGTHAASRVSSCFVSLGPFGLAPRFRAAVEQGDIELDEHSGHGLTAALEAASRGLPFHPFHGPVSTSLASRYPRVTDPTTGLSVHATPARPLDVALVHAEAATRNGHVLLAGTVGTDVVLARAADHVVVTTERLVGQLPSSGSRYLAAGEVHTVVECPWGAHPSAMVPDYGMDWRSLLAYADASQASESFARWVASDLRDDERVRTDGISADHRDLLHLAAGTPGP